MAPSFLDARWVAAGPGCVKTHESRHTTPRDQLTTTHPHHLASSRRKKAHRGGPVCRGSFNECPDLISEIKLPVSAVTSPQLQRRLYSDRPLSPSAAWKRLRLLQLPRLKDLHQQGLHLMGDRREIRQ